MASGEPAWLFWRPLREGDGEGDAPPWRTSRPLDHASALDEIEWLAREGDWIARIETPDGRSDAFVLRRGVVTRLPDVEWWNGTDGDLGWDRKDLRVQPRRRDVDNDWVRAWESDRDPGDMACTAALAMDTTTTLRMLVAAWETRRGDLAAGRHRRHLLRHAALLHTLLRDDTVGARDGIAALEMLSNHAEFLERRGWLAPPGVSRGGGFEAYSRHYSACAGLLQAWNVAVITLWKNRPGYPWQTRRDVAGYAATCLRAVRNTLDGASACDPAAPRRAMVRSVGDRLYLALTQEPWSPRDG